MEDERALIARSLAGICNPVPSPNVSDVLEISQEEIGL
jgi:hypothetical protein